MWKTAALLSFFLVLPLHAQEQPDWAQIEQVEVKARPGPAVWHLTRGNSEVWLLGTVGAMPKAMDWNKDYLSELLDGSRAILMPPKADIGLVDIAWFLILHGGELSLPRGQTLEAGLNEPLRAHFIATRSAVSDDARDYATDIPIRAAIRLQQDMMKKAELSGREPNETIGDLARRKHIANKPISQFAAMDAIRDVLKLSPDQQRICLAEAVEDVDWSLGHAGKAAHAWAVGDIKGVKANYSESRLGNCVMAALHVFADMDARNIADTGAAIDAALNQSGKAIAVVGMRQLLKRGGVLERLQAMHVTIEGPSE